MCQGSTRVSPLEAFARQALALLLSVAMTIQLVPTVALAVDEDPAVAEVVVEDAATNTESATDESAESLAATADAAEDNSAPEVGAEPEVAEPAYFSGDAVFKGDDYTVTVTVPASAKIPADAKIIVAEVTDDTYQDYYDTSLDATEATTFEMARFFDISFAVDVAGEQVKVEPEGDVTVTVQLDKALPEDQKQAALHFADGEDGQAEHDANGELVLSAPDVLPVETAGSELTFVTEGFSVFGVVSYTVDFEHDGYRFSMAGGTSMLLSKLFAALGIKEDVADVVDVVYSTTEQLTVTQVTGEVTLDNGTTLDAGEGDWLLTSLASFQTEETLTVTMANGTVYVIKVTDAVPVADGTVHYPSNPVETIDNPSGTVITVFDYWTNTELSADFSYDGVKAQDPAHYYDEGEDTGIWRYGVDDNTGINKDHALKFRYWDCDLDTNNTRGQDINTIGAANLYTGDDYSGQDHAAVMQGIVTNTLVGGYPQLSGQQTVNHPTGQSGNLFNSAYDGGESLSYLFDSVDRDGKKVYSGANGLFQVDDEGYYYYDSEKNAARLNLDTRQFVVGDAEYIQEDDKVDDYNTGFWPITDGINRHYFGLKMDTQFSQPVDGTVLNPSGEYKPMEFTFRGDDDVWLYIDGVLVGDLGGIHQASSLDINFQTGDVMVNGAVVGTLKSFFEAAGRADLVQWNGNTFADGTYHSMNFFYMERGNGDSNMNIRYNMVSTDDFTAHKSLQRFDADDPVLAKGQFDFKMTGYDGLWESVSDGQGGYHYQPVAGDTTQAIMPTALTPETVDGGRAVTKTNSVDGNVNFGKADIPQEMKNDSYKYKGYRYKIEEIVPADATATYYSGGEEKTITYADYAAGTVTDIPADVHLMWTKDGVVYTDTVYYMIASITSWEEVAADGTSVTEWGLSKTYYTDDTFQTVLKKGDEYAGTTFEGFANFDNSYLPSVKLRGTKELQGKKLTEGEYSFELTPVDGEVEGTPIDANKVPMPRGGATTASNTAPGEDGLGLFSFGKIEYVTEGTYNYTIKEKIPSPPDENVTYDESVWNVQVAVTFNHDDDVFETEVTYTKQGTTETAEGAAFVNKYEARATADIDAKKQLLDAEGTALDLAADKFSYDLTLVSVVDADGNDVEDDAIGTVVATMKNTAATAPEKGDVLFDDEIVFTTEDFANANTNKLVRTYTITEDLTGTAAKEIGGTTYGHVKGGINYDDTSYTAVVTATLNDDGTISVDVAYDPVTSTMQAVFVKDTDTTGHIKVTVENATPGEYTITGSDGAPLPSPASIDVTSPSGTFSSVPIDLTSATEGTHTFTYTVASEDNSLSASFDIGFVKTTEITGNGKVTVSLVQNPNDASKAHVHVALDDVLTNYNTVATLTGSSGAPMPPWGNEHGLYGNLRTTEEFDYNDIDFSSLSDGTHNFTYTVTVGSIVVTLPVQVEKSTSYTEIPYSIAASNVNKPSGEDTTATITVTTPEPGWRLFWSWSDSREFNSVVTGEKVNVTISQWNSDKKVHLQNSSSQNQLTIDLAKGPLSASGSLRVSTGSTYTFTANPAEYDDHTETVTITNISSTTGEATHTSSTTEALFTNVQVEEPPAELIVTKTVTGDYADLTKKFTFTLSGLPAGTDTLTGVIEAADGTTTSVTFNASSLTFQLGNGESLTISDLPKGSSLTVTETAVTGYTTTVADSTTGTETTTSVSGSAATVTNADGTTTFAYTNKYDSVIPTGIASNLGPWFTLLGAVGTLGVAYAFRRLRRRSYGARRFRSS